MSTNFTQIDVSDLLKALERKKLDDLNERRKANRQKTEPIPQDLMTDEERLKKNKE